MNIEGLDYNTQRERLILPEYGREVQDMVDYCLKLKDRDERQKCANTIVEIMERMFPKDSYNDENYKQKLWDHLAIMSKFQLDIDYPYDVNQATKIATKPEPMEYPMKKIPVRHYGSMIFELFDKLKTEKPGEEREELVRITANQMKRNLVQWSHGTSDDQKVADDLARYTDGKVQLDLDHFSFDKINDHEMTGGKKKKK
ncbi:MAG TPA: DUF4290 domain-containing protein [Prevotella sp.]|nr:DUF4290 domain-containing protein [Prevotella sp.]